MDQGLLVARRTGNANLRSVEIGERRSEMRFHSDSGRRADDNVIHVRPLDGNDTSQRLGSDDPLHLCPKGSCTKRKSVQAEYNEGRSGKVDAESDGMNLLTFLRKERK